MIIFRVKHLLYFPCFFPKNRYIWHKNPWLSSWKSRYFYSFDSSQYIHTRHTSIFHMKTLNQCCFRDMLVNCEISRQPQPAVILWDVDINLMNLILDFMYIGEVKVYINCYVLFWDSKTFPSFIVIPIVLRLSSFLH